MGARVGSACLHLSASSAPSAAAVLAHRDPGTGTRTVIHDGLLSLVITLTGGFGRTVTHAGTCVFEVGTASGWPGDAA